MQTHTFGELTVRVIGSVGAGPTVVLHHGFGAPGDDLVSLAREVNAPEETCWLFPEAPLALPPEFGMGRAWWMIDVMRFQMAMLSGRMDDMPREEPEELGPVREKVVAMLDAAQRELGFDFERMVLGGFSQGAMVSCDVALRADRPFGALALMSGTYLAKDEWAPRMEKLVDKPVLQSHGRDDQLLPFSLAEQLRDDLAAAGADLAWHEFAGGHGIAPNVVAGLGDLLHKL